MIVITGASGLIGTALTKRLSSHPLRLQVRRRARLSPEIAVSNVQVKEIDFESCSDNSISAILQGADTVIHSAGLVHKPEAGYGEYELLNVRATEQIATLAAKAGVKTFVFLSTSAVYGSGPFENISESAPLKAETPYAVSKLRCEQFLKNLGTFERTIVIRPALVFGEGDRGNLISLIRQINTGKYFNIGGNKAEKSLIYAADVAEAIALLLEKSAAGYQEYNVANPETISVTELSNQIALCLKKNNKLVSVPEPLLRAGASVLQGVLGNKAPVSNSKLDKLTTTTTCSVAKLTDTTNFQPTFSLTNALSNEIAWAKASGLLN
ncbi:MAG: NAD-dependent epimerase/dehydratase family protein [Candidatus Obscuribacterales bacterium]|nr:NAD-dependent epimerase/dehydratase family protein [Candidatus Obscuribacterales bacterium]